MNPKLLPCYNILSLNGVKSANNMLKMAHSGSWLNALESTLWHMLEKITVLQQAYKKKDSEKVTDIVHKRYMQTLLLVGLTVLLKLIWVFI